jgi:hypothetical protein
VAGCGSIAHGRVVARVKPSKSGRFSVTFVLPKTVAGTGGLVSLRAQTVLRAGAKSHRKVAVIGLTRSLLVTR